VRLERGDAAAQRLTGDLHAVGRAKPSQPRRDQPAHGVRFEAQAAPSGVKALLVASPPERFGDFTFSMGPELQNVTAQTFDANWFTRVALADG
jgi:hypothetical protein